MNINIYKSPQMCLYYESNTNSCCIPAGILPESMESGHSCRIPGFLLDSGGIPPEFLDSCQIPPEFSDSGRNQWGSEKFWYFSFHCLGYFISLPRVFFIPAWAFFIPCLGYFTPLPRVFVIPA